MVFFKFCLFKFDIIEKSVSVIKKKSLTSKGFKNKTDYSKKELLYLFNQKKNTGLMKLTHCECIDLQITNYRQFLQLY